jgi:hypothetical protein
MSPIVRFVGFIWTVGPICLLGVVVSAEWRSADVGASLAAALPLLLLAYCGAHFLGGLPGAKWVLRAAACLVLLVLVLGVAAELSWPNKFEPRNPFSVITEASLVVFCILTVFIAGRRAT